MTYRRWFVFGAAFAVIGALVASFAIFYGSFSPRGFVEDRYSRTSRLDIGSQAKAYTSPKRAERRRRRRSPCTWRPADQYVDGSGVYLRYDDDSVVILPLGRWLADPAGRRLQRAIRATTPRSATRGAGGGA